MVTESRKEKCIYCFCLFCARVCSECPYKADQSGTMAIVRHSPLLPTIGIPPFGVPLCVHSEGIFGKYDLLFACIGILGRQIQG